MAMRIFENSLPSPSWGEFQSRPLLQAYDIPVVTADFAHSAAVAADIADKIGYPVVLKIVSPDILHKSDFGGIRLNLHTRSDVLNAATDLFSHFMDNFPSINIQGLLVESMVPKGHEMIIGMRRDPNFGPLIMFGIGGIFVELFNDVAFGVAPIDRSYARKMIEKTKAGQVLAGLRGQKPCDIESVIDVLVKLSQLALDFPQISEIEINPLVVYESGAVALDARTIFRTDNQK